MFLNFFTIVCLELNCFPFAVAANYLSPPYLKFFLESLNVLSSSKDFRSCFLLLNLLCFSLQRKDSIFYDKIYSYLGRHGVRLPSDGESAAETTYTGFPS